MAKDGPLEVWAKKLEDGSRAVGLFNRGEAEDRVRVTWGQLGLAGLQRVRDLWRQKGSRPSLSNSYSARVRPHGVVLVRIGPVATGAPP